VCRTTYHGNIERTVTSRLHMLVFALGGLAACPDLHERKTGDDCQTTAFECQGFRVAWRCFDGQWTAEDCFATCAEHDQFPYGCLETHDGVTCQCESLQPTTCEEDLARCVSAKDLLACHNGVDVLFDCSDVCEATAESSGQELYPAGCSYDRVTKRDGCSCLASGDDCDDRAFTLCADPEHLGTCINGRWGVISCVDVCLPGHSRGCMFEPSDNAGTCSCEDLDYRQPP